MASLVAEADCARDARRFGSAALLYRRFLEDAPDNAGIHVQCAHMFKEAGDLAAAERHYLAAHRLTPDDSDLALQMGHFYKVAGQRDRARAAYQEAVRLRPGWAAPAHELAEFERKTAHGMIARQWQGHGLSAERISRLVPELAPRPASDLSLTSPGGVQVRRLGTPRERSPWGLLSSLRGVEAIRGFCVSTSPLRAVLVLLDGRVLAEEALQAFPVTEMPGSAKYVFNVWLDLSAVTPGLYEIELRLTGPGATSEAHRESVVVGPPRREAECPDSDAVVDLPGPPGTPVSAQVHAKPSVVRPASRNALPPTLNNVLVLRTDQLGDMITSLPALRRLRELLPASRIVVLVTDANADFARTLALFDEVIVIDFPDDAVERRRIMSLEQQDALRQRLAPYRFDLAIDLAESAVSRPLLLLSGARFLYGFHHREWPWLDAGFDGATRDPANRLECAPQSTRVMALIERLAATMQSRAERLRRPDLPARLLPGLGLGPEERFAVLHAGARIAFSRWPHYQELAELLLATTDLVVVLITDDAGLRDRLSETLRTTARFRLIDRRLAFDELDLMVSHCVLFVGNDSGPKHLAALRGANVVSIHSSRINWNEWGQELSGVIVSRRVPCAGCALFHHPEECGKDHCCVTQITPDEILRAAAPFVAVGQGSSAASGSAPAINTSGR